MFILRYAAIVPALAAVASVAGCGTRNAQISGRIVDNGREVVALRGAPEGPFLTFRCPEAQFTGSCGLGPNDGRFVVYAPDGRMGLPPGKYKVGFLYGNTPTPKTGKDFDADESPIELTLESGQQLDVTIDVGKRVLTQ